MFGYLLHKYSVPFLLRARSSQRSSAHCNSQATRIQRKFLYTVSQAAICTARARFICYYWQTIKRRLHPWGLVATKPGNQSCLWILFLLSCIMHNHLYSSAIHLLIWDLHLYSFISSLSEGRAVYVFYFPTSLRILAVVVNPFRNKEIYPSFLEKQFRDACQALGSVPENFTFHVWAKSWEFHAV